MPSKAIGGAGLSTREIALARGALIAVGIAYLVLQLSLSSPNRAPGWDESVYLSQVTPGTKAVFFMASRARGITLLVAPVTWLGGSIGAVRLYLAVISAISMTAAFLVWVPLVGLAVPIAAFVFSTSWLSLMAGSEVMPNLWAAILGIAAVGLIARRLAGGPSRDALLAAPALAAMAVFRPTEATFVVVAVAVYVLVFRRSSWRVLVPAGIGLFAGWLPWVVEMSARFGGPLSALRAAGQQHFGLAQAGWNVRTNLVYLDGRVPGSAVPLAAVVAWIVFLALAVVATLRSPRATDRAVALLCCFAAAIVVLEYVVFVQASAGRFLIPAYAFISLPVGIGVVTLLRGRGGARAAGATVLALLVPWTIWQGVVANRVGSRSTDWSASLREVGQTLGRLAADHPCSYLSPLGYPEIQLFSGCVGSSLVNPSEGPSKSELVRLQSHGALGFVVIPMLAPSSSPLGSLTPVESGGPQFRWYVYRISPLAG